MFKLNSNYTHQINVHQNDVYCEVYFCTAVVDITIASWTDGAFGYFPSYTLGAMYAAQFMASIKKTVDVNSMIESGDLFPIFTWLESNIWSKGSLLTTDDLVKGATGETLNAQYFKDHLRSRYL